MKGSSKQLFTTLMCHSLFESHIFQDLFLPQKNEKKIKLFLDYVFFHMTHTHALYLPPIVYNKWSVASWSKSPKTCNVENYPKL
jgi:hypothetical protein